MKVLQKRITEEDLELAKMRLNNDFILPVGAELKGGATILLNPFDHDQVENLLLFEWQNNEYVYRIKGDSKFDEFILLF